VREIKKRAEEPPAVRKEAGHDEEIKKKPSPTKEV
jgi:hypothetical protein